MLTERCEWLAHTSTAALLVKEALEEDTLVGVWARQCLALAVAGMFCALASVAGVLGRPALIPVGSGEARWSARVPGAEMKPNKD